MALRIEKAFGVSMALLLNMQLAYDAAEARARARDIHVRRFHPVPVP
jgi:plasmid maintenance system antidote protein VapI